MHEPYKYPVCDGMENKCDCSPKKRVSWDAVEWLTYAKIDDQEWLRIAWSWKDTIIYMYSSIIYIMTYMYMYVHLLAGVQRRVWGDYWLCVDWLPGVHSWARDGEVGPLPGLSRTAAASSGLWSPFHPHLPQVHSRTDHTAPVLQTGVIFVMIRTVCIGMTLFCHASESCTCRESSIQIHPEIAWNQMQEL